jgi:Arc/MetJ-type ribon-helix-helix transcriptional regulator
MDQRKQINVRVDADVLAAIEDIRAMSRPIPSVSDVVRVAILERRERVRRQLEREGAAHADKR